MNTPSHSTQDASEWPGTEQHAHDVPIWVLVAVFAALLLLTLITVAVTRVDLGSFNVWVALTIACVKATLVALFFMHLAYDKPFNSVVMGTAVFLVGFFISLATLDVLNYEGNIDAFRAAHPDRVEPMVDQALDVSEATG
jgi:cytochrome c oxidase subunit 4